MKKSFQKRKLIRASNSIDPANPIKGIIGKGGSTTNFEIPGWMFRRELVEISGGKWEGE